MAPQDMREAILLATLDHVALDGWTRRSLDAGACDAGFKAIDGQRAFPAGMLALVEYLFEYGDRQMAQTMGRLDISEMKVRARVATAVRTRLSVMAAHREAMRRALSFMALPQNAGAALACTYRTVDTIWYAVGDTATDFSFYTKRALLAGVFAATVLYWLGDESAGSQETWNFLDRRISGIMRLMSSVNRR